MAAVYETYMMEMGRVWTDVLDVWEGYQLIVAAVTEVWPYLIVGVLGQHEEALHGIRLVQDRR